MTEEELKKGVIRTLIILVILIVVIIGVGVYVFADRNNPNTIFTNAELKEEYEKVEDTSAEKVEQITDQNQINQILNTDLQTEQ